MRARNELDRLAVAGRPLHAEADALVSAGEVDFILKRILSADRPASVGRKRPRAVFVLVGAVALAVAVATAAVMIGREGSRNNSHGLTGATIHLAGYRFKTPAGFTTSNSGSCYLVIDGFGHPPGAQPPPNAFSSAASADGGCVEAFGTGSPSGFVVPPNADPVEVDGYQGYVVHGELLLLFLWGTPLEPDGAYFALASKGVTEEQLIAIAQSGLPAKP